MYWVPSDKFRLGTHGYLQVCLRRFGHVLLTACVLSFIKSPNIFSGMNIHLPAILGFTRYQGFDPSPIVEALRYISIPKKPKNPLGSHSWMWPWLLSVLWPPQLAALRHRKWPSRNSWIFPLNMVIFHSYVKLPEGNYHGKHNYGKTINSMMFFQFVM